MPRRPGPATDLETGRLTASLIETATAAPYLSAASGVYRQTRRFVGDVYLEGELLWLDIDTIIRERTHGGKSLDTFMQLFAGLPNSGPITKTYTVADIEKLLNEVVPYEWHAFFRQHVYDIAVNPPTDELARAGWRIVYTATPNRFGRDYYKLRLHGLEDDEWLSYGIMIGENSLIKDVRVGSPAWQAGMAPGMVIKAVDGQAYTPETLRYLTIQSEHSTDPTTFLVEQDGWYQTHQVSYHDGPRYPHLERIAGTTDMLAEIVAPHSTGP